MSKRNPSALPPNKTLSPSLLDDLRRLIGEAQRKAAAVNISLTMLYWHVGKRIREEALGQGRAEYGEQIVATLSRQLQAEYGRGFAEKNLRRMILKTTVVRFQNPFALSLSKGERILELHPAVERRKIRSCPSTSLRRAFDKLSTNGFFCVLTAIFSLPASGLKALAQPTQTLICYHISSVD